MSIPHPLEDTTPEITPMMAQYLEIKAQYPDCVLLFRLGDFYEIFLDDAPKVANALGIQLTKRGKHQGEDIAMCGIPWHQLDNYLPDLIKQGYKVALCEQLEDPAEAKKRGYKAIVKRDVVRIVTAGTLTEDTLLDAHSNNYLAAVATIRDGIAVAWCDLSTGDFCTQSTSQKDLGSVLASLNPSEILIPQKLQQNPDFFDLWRQWKSVLSFQPDSTFNPTNTLRYVEQFYGVATLDAFGDFSPSETTAAGALLNYIHLTQKGGIPKLTAPRAIRAQHALRIDASTRRNLELTHTLAGSKKGSVLSVIDHTQTAAGGRLLRQYFALPLTQSDAINDRLEHVAFWVARTEQRQALQALLKTCPDLERGLSRLSLGRGSPRDLAAIRDALITGEKVAERLSRLENIPATLHALWKQLPLFLSLTNTLEQALAPDLPFLARDGGFIKTGYNLQLDTTRKYANEGLQLIRDLEQHYQAVSRIPQLKIKHNGVLGYYIEVSTKVADSLKEPFIHRQTLANAARFTTEELNTLQSKLIKSSAEAQALEMEIFQTLIAETLQQSDTLRRTASTLATLDVATALAHLAVIENYCCPVVDESTAFEIKGGRHPVVEQALQAQHNTPFIPNDCALAEAQKLWLLTGPNMAGKSTFLRQNALITLLAQIGSFVPAAEAHIGTVDAIYSRVGAGDDLAQGRSTFMVEMVETAAIVNQATPRSLVILDEIGRGTATYDGLSLAWATLEHLHDVNQCRTLFATHYHELNQLEARLPHLKGYTMQVEETNTGIVFLHHVARGKADRSYGIFVAQLAGMPPAILERSEEILRELEKAGEKKALTDLPLFKPQYFSRGTTAKAPSSVETKLKEFDIDSMSPKEALEALYVLRGLCG